MIGYPEAFRAWGLTRGMARISGVNLPRAVVDGWLHRSELDSLVSRCASCGQGVRCEGWLGDSSSARSQALPAIPEFCPNKPGIEALAG
jgi:hypothetical protein